MKTYWNLPESERAQLSDLQVEDYLKIELMEKGVLRPDEPVLEEPVQMPKIPTTTLYTIDYVGDYSTIRDTLGVAWIDADDAQAFLDSGVVWVRNKGGVKYGTPISEREPRIVPVKLASEEDINANADATKEAKAIVDRNEGKMRPYNAARKEAAAAKESLLNDWRACKTTMSSCMAVSQTWEEYLDMCDDDKDVAAKFLRKAYEDEIIATANEWLSLEIPKEIENAEENV